MGARLQRLAGMDLLVDSVVLLALPVSLSLMQGSRRDAVMEPRYRRLFWTSNALFAYLRTRRGRCCQPCCELPDLLNSPLISLVCACALLQLLAELWWRREHPPQRRECRVDCMRRADWSRAAQGGAEDDAALLAYIARNNP